MIESNNKSCPSNILSKKDCEILKFNGPKGWWKCTKPCMSGNLSRAHMFEPREQKSYMLWHTDTDSSGIGYL